MNAAPGNWLSRLLGGRAAPDAGGERVHLDAWMREGYEHQQQGRLTEAAQRYREILNADPLYADAAFFLGTILDGEGRSDEAVSLYRAAVEAKPEESTFVFALGNQYYRARRFEEAAQTLGRGLKLKPDDVDGRKDHGLCLMELGRWEEALAVLEPLAAAHPDNFSACANLASVYRQLGRVQDSIAQYRKAIALDPEHLGAQNSLLFTLNYSDQHDARAIAEEHRAFGLRHARPAPLPPPDSHWPRRLRIGYLSPDFRRHVVMTFIEPVLEGHDREKFEVFCFHTHREKDEVTERLRARVEHWSDCGGLSDDAIADRIRAQRIDILVDLAGHTSGHRVGVLATKPAPIQITYLGYPNTTGLPTVDYRITDDLADPPGSADELNVERLLRLPRPFLCFRPDAEAPDPVPPPVLSKGYVTFGSFNNTLKLSDRFLDIAASVIKAVPGSRLVLKGGALELQPVADRVRQRFDVAGVSPDRVDLRGWTAAMEDHLGAYREIDIALDSFPYNGTTTTCEALWMGVPVVTLQGDRHAARVGASLLGWLGLAELVAGDDAEFVRICARLARDVESAAFLRAGLRERVRVSLLADEAGMVRELERCYQAVWLEQLRPVPDAQQ